MKGHDNAGDWKGYFFQYQLGTTPNYVLMLFKLYKGFTVFEHRYLNGTNNASNGDKHTVSCGFPSFYIDKLDSVGYLAWGGWMTGDTHRTLGMALYFHQNYFCCISTNFACFSMH